MPFLCYVQREQDEEISIEWELGASFLRHLLVRHFENVLSLRIPPTSR